jgi:hypothetical protein
MHSTTIVKPFATAITGTRSQFASRAIDQSANAKAALAAIAAPPGNPTDVRQPKMPVQDDGQVRWRGNSTPDAAHIWVAQHD